MADISGIIQSLNHGSLNDQIEAIAIVRGTVTDWMLRPFFERYQIDSLKKKVAKMQPLSLSDSQVKDLLDALANASTKPNLSKYIEAFTCWYATVAMVQFGELTPTALKFLWGMANNIMTTLGELGEDPQNAVVAGSSEDEVREETIRALSRFKDFPEVGKMLEECLNDEALKGRQPTKKYPVLCAFGALGFQEYRKVVEDWATQNYDKDAQNGAKAALELWGRGSYDDINRLFESKAGLSSSTSGGGGGGCFIATAVYGSPIANEVNTFKQFRDDSLMRSFCGRQFVKIYYAVSPMIAARIKNYPIIKSLLRTCLLEPLLIVIKYVNKK